MDAVKISKPANFPPSPRRVRPRPQGFGGRFISLIYLLFIIGGLLSLAVVPVRNYVQSHGSSVRVTVDGKYVSHSSRHGDTYHVKFNYSFDGEPISDSQEVTSTEYDRAEPGTAANGKAARILGMNFCLTDIGDIDQGTHKWMVITGLWNLIAWVVFGVAVFKAIQARRLVQQGVAAPGKVTNLRTTRGRSTYRYVAYEFTTTTGKMLTHERTVSLAGYNSVAIGSPVTVLYDHDDPNKSIVYECANYAVEGVL